MSVHVVGNNAVGTYPRCVYIVRVRLNAIAVRVFHWTHHGASKCVRPYILIHPYCSFVNIYDRFLSVWRSHNSVGFRMSAVWHGKRQKCGVTVEALIDSWLHVFFAYERLKFKRYYMAVYGVKVGCLLRRMHAFTPWKSCFLAWNSPVSDSLYRLSANAC